MNNQLLIIIVIIIVILYIIQNSTPVRENMDNTPPSTIFQNIKSKYNLDDSVYIIPDPSNCTDIKKHIDNLISIGYSGRNIRDLAFELCINNLEIDVDKTMESIKKKIKLKYNLDDSIYIKQSSSTCTNIGKDFNKLRQFVPSDIKDIRESNNYKLDIHYNNRIKHLALELCKYNLEIDNNINNMKNVK